jgi:Ca-activated chloride channel family protein
VDKTPSRPADARLSRADIPLNLPAGWDFDKVFGKPIGGERRAQEGGSAPQGQEEDARMLDAGYIQKIAVAHKPASANAALKQTVASVPLPKTATPASLLLALGLALIAANIAVVVMVCRREKLDWE